MFTPLPCDFGEGRTVCAEYGGYTYFGLSYRDTDWYVVYLDQASQITWCVEGEYDSLMGIIDGNTGCPVLSFYDYTFAEPCVEACLTAPLPAGEWWFFVATNGFGPSAGACGGNYNSTLTRYICEVSVDAFSWGRIKNLYE